MGESRYRSEVHDLGDIKVPVDLDDLNYVEELEGDQDDQDHTDDKNVIDDGEDVDNKGDVDSVGDVKDLYDQDDQMIHAIHVPVERDDLNYLK